MNSETESQRGEAIAGVPVYGQFIPIQSRVNIDQLTPGSLLLNCEKTCMVINFTFLSMERNKRTEKILWVFIDRLHNIFTDMEINQSWFAST